MFVKVHKSIGKTSLNNKGSSGAIISYLSKENQDKKPQDYEHFFNHDADKINESSSQKLLDSQNRHLGKNDSKFFMFTINPSSSELKHLLKISGVDKEVKNIDSLTKVERDRFDTLLKSYTKNVMELYANNFNKGIQGKDLVYVAKVEQKRSYKSFHEEVKHNASITKKIHDLVVDRIKAEDSGNTREFKSVQKKIDTLKSEYLTLDNKPLASDKGNIIKAGDHKQGLQTHVHVVVHRNTKDFVKISPNANSKGHTQKNQKGKKIQIGFSHEQFKRASSEMFEKQFDYKSKENEKHEFSKLSNVANKVHKVTNNQATNLIKNKIKSEVYKNAFEEEFLNMKAKGGQLQSLISDLAKVTKPHKLLVKGVKKVLSNTAQKLR